MTMMMETMMLLELTVMPFMMDDEDYEDGNALQGSQGRRRLMY